MNARYDMFTIFIYIYIYLRVATHPSFHERNLRAELDWGKQKTLKVSFKNYQYYFPFIWCSNWDGGDYSSFFHKHRDLYLYLNLIMQPEILK